MGFPHLHHENVPKPHFTCVSYITRDFNMIERVLSIRFENIMTELNFLGEPFLYVGMLGIK